MFKASNGVEVSLIETGGRQYLETVSGRHGPPLRIAYRQEEVDAIREFFRDERDQELGRWRSKQIPNWVAYPSSEHYVSLFAERTGESFLVTREEAEEVVTSEPWGMERAVAREYFEAHPNVKPWHDAQPGEVWILTIAEDYTEPAIAVKESDGVIRFMLEGEYGTDFYIPTHPAISDGRRIWPTPEEDQ